LPLLTFIGQPTPAINGRGSLKSRFSPPTTVRLDAAAAGTAEVLPFRKSRGHLKIARLEISQ